MSCTSLTIISLAILSLVFLVVTDINVTCDYYVSTNGNDTTGNGTIGSPFQTIEQSLNKAKNVSNLAPKVCLREGTHSCSLTNYISGNLTIFSVDGSQRAILHLTINTQRDIFHGEGFYWFIGLKLTNLSITSICKINQITMINSTCDTTDITATYLILSDCDFQGKTFLTSPYSYGSIIIQKCKFKYMSRIVVDGGEITIQECYFQYSSVVDTDYGQITLQESQIVGLLDSLSLLALDITVKDCLFNNNTNGALLFTVPFNIYGSGVTIQNCSFTDNKNDVLHFRNTVDNLSLTVQDCSFTDNKNGVLSIESNHDLSVTIQNCSFTDNKNDVLQFRNNVDDLSLTDCSFTDNFVQASIIYLAYSPLSFTMDNCNFSCPINEHGKPVIFVNDKELTFSPKFLNISVDNCEPQCSPGTFSVGDLTSCFDCPAGTYTNTSNAQVCSKCNGGSWSGRGKDHCTYCSPGFARPSYYQGDCQECWDGFVQPNSGGTICNACDPGLTSDNSHIKCIPCAKGTAKNKQQYDCTPCQPGTFSNYTGAIKCSDCPPGYTSKIGDIWCTKCLSGQYQPKWGGSSCLTCPIGEISKIGARICQPCPSGSITFTFGDNTICVDCIPGSYSNSSDEGSLCLTCHPGTYSNVRASSCFSCPSGTYQPASGAGFCFQCNGISTTTECTPCIIWLDGQNCSNLSFVSLLVIIGGVLISVGVAFFSWMRYKSNKIKYTQLLAQ